jgi:hypothetical protein
MFGFPANNSNRIKLGFTKKIYVYHNKLTDNNTTNMTDNNMATNDMTDSSDDEDTTTMVPSKKLKLTFPKVTWERYDNGVLQTSHPFMEDPTEQEMEFAKLLAWKKPFVCMFQQTTTSWESFLIQLNAKKTSDGKELLFPVPMKLRFAQDRLKEYIQYVQKGYGKLPLQSACDDIPPPLEFQQLLEEIHLLKTSHDKKQDQ